MAAIEAVQSRRTIPASGPVRGSGRVALATSLLRAQRKFPFVLTGKGIGPWGIMGGILTHRRCAAEQATTCCADYYCHLGRPNRSGWTYKAPLASWSSVVPPSQYLGKSRLAIFIAFPPLRIRSAVKCDLFRHCPTNRVPGFTDDYELQLLRTCN